MKKQIKKDIKKLMLNKETVSILNPKQQTKVVGGNQSAIVGGTHDPQWGSN